MIVRSGAPIYSLLASNSYTMRKDQGGIVRPVSILEDNSLELILHEANRGSDNFGGVILPVGRLGQSVGLGSLLGIRSTPVKALPMFDRVRRAELSTAEKTEILRAYRDGKLLEKNIFLLELYWRRDFKPGRENGRRGAFTKNSQLRVGTFLKDNVYGSDRSTLAVLSTTSSKDKLLVQTIAYSNVISEINSTLYGLPVIKDEHITQMKYLLRFVQAKPTNK